MKPTLVVPIASKPTKETLEHIQKLVDGIESGEYVGFAAVGIKPVGLCQTFTCAPTTDILVTIGAVSCLLYDLQKEVLRTA